MVFSQWLGTHELNCRLFLSTGAGSAGLNLQHVAMGAGVKDLACLGHCLDCGVIQARDNIRCENGQVSFH